MKEQYASLRGDINSLDIGVKVAIERTIRQLVEGAANSPSLSDYHAAQLAQFIAEEAVEHVKRLYRDGKIESYLEHKRKYRHVNP